ncbi:MAG: phosphoribosylamine--glycine ligase [Deltaproteobacteria bacterium]|nr:phosphoribosylamine--glycine ligase [Deltaproteobacteria bacterium]
MKKAQELLTKPIRVAVLGAGGREHALASKIAASPLCREVTVLPGNDGMARAGRRTAAVDLKDFAAVRAKLEELSIDFVVIGPDDLLAAGIVDELESAGIAVFGPNKAAARIEWSKTFAKELMLAAGVPTAKYEAIDAAEMARLPEIVESLGGYPLVFKYDGLALGKGVRICVDLRDAEEFLKEVFQDQKFSGSAAKKNQPRVVIEQVVGGHEVSLFALTDGMSYTVLDPACDHKRLQEGNIGPNTGGMGAYSPVPWFGREDVNEFSEKIFPPLLAKMREAKTPFRGLLYAGLMVKGRDFWVLEFNARFGDPETQAVLPRMESDLLPLLYGIGTGAFPRHLDANPVRWSSQACVNVVLASRGYPEKPETGFAVSGIATDCASHRIYYAGVKARENLLVTSGGRVLGVSGLGESIEAARQSAIAVIEKMHFEGMRYRRDIGSVRSNY